MLRVATVFSGIGAFEQALKKNKILHKIIFACDNGGLVVNYDHVVEFKKIKNINSIASSIKYINEIYSNTKRNNYVEKSYLANYKIDKNAFFQDIKLLNGNLFRNKLDFLVGGSPCQSFSILGKRKGFDDDRGALFYEFARLIKETKPKYFIYENVPGVLSHNNGKTWKSMTNIFDSLGYKYKYQVLNSMDYNMPQNRKRLFVIGTLLDKEIKFPEPETLKCTAENFLERYVDEKYYFKKKGFQFITNPKNKNRAKINETIIMCQKAQQQFNWNGSFIFHETNDNTKKFSKDIYRGKFEDKMGFARKMTPRECLRLMGFTEEFKVVVPDKEIYHQVGNSIVVNVIEKILDSLEIK